MTVQPAPGGEFAELINEVTGEMETLSKAMPSLGDDTTDDAAIRAAAEEAGNAVPPEGEEEDEKDGKKKPCEAAGGEQPPALAKSFGVQLPDGTTAQAIDAEELVTNLLADNEALRQQNNALGGALKSVGGMVKALHTTASEQAEMIKSLRGEVRALAASGSGRRSVVVAPRAAEPPKPAALNREQVMAKALSLQSEQKISASDISRITAHLNRGFGIPDEYARLFSA